MTRVVAHHAGRARAGRQVKLVDRRGGGQIPMQHHRRCAASALLGRLKDEKLIASRPGC